MCTVKCGLRENRKDREEELKQNRGIWLTIRIQMRPWENCLHEFDAKTNAIR